MSRPGLVGSALHRAKGTVEGGGTIIAGWGFTVIRVGIGNFTLTLNEPIGNTEAIALATSRETAIVTVGALVAGVATVSTRDAANVLIDADWSIAVDRI